MCFAVDGPRACRSPIALRRSWLESSPHAHQADLSTITCTARWTWIKNPKIRRWVCGKSPKRSVVLYSWIYSLCSVEPSNATKRHRQSGWCIQVAINHGTKRIDVTEAHPSANPRAPEMHTGDVFAFSGSNAHRFPPTQWQRDLLFTAYNDAM